MLLLLLLAGYGAASTGEWAGQPQPAHKQQALMGRWRAYHVSYGVGLGAAQPAPTDTLFYEYTFQPAGQGFSRYGRAGRQVAFTYRLRSGSVIELRYPHGKPQLRTFYLTTQKLSLRPYPAAKEATESIAILYTLTFTKQ